MLRCSRNTDAVFRLGGDEFAIVMPNTAAADAIRHCQTLCQAMGADMAAAGWSVTASIGVASFSQAPESVDFAVLQADAAMYAAKALRASKGCVVGV
jgi:diguanylate cyclase (GGDEF)-like protein